jgi:fatty-acyl-CoA synthase
MAETLQQLLRERAEDDTVGLKYGDQSWSWREHIAEASAQAAALISAADHDRPMHVGALLGNTPDMLRALAAAGLGGFTLCGINTTRRGPALARDIMRVDTQILLVNPEHRALIEGLDLSGVRVIDVSTPEWATEVADAPALTPHRESAPDDTFMMIFTSGTSGEPKAVQVPHVVVLIAGMALVAKYEVSTDDVGYLSMPLFHSNAVYAGWAVTLVSGAAMVPAKFSASRFLADVRKYGVTYMNYVGKPLAYILATPTQSDDHDNPLRVAFGNEASDRDIDEFARRFDCSVWDGFGSTENAIIVIREDGCPPGSIGKGYPGVAVYHPDTVQECEVAEFDDAGALLNSDAAVGELVNTTGSGLFRGYYNDPSATDERIKHGMYWSGDLAYRDADGWIYFAGRSADWLRVDGENMATAPIERVLVQFPAVSRAVVYAVPDELVGDQVMAAIVLRDGAEFDAGEFEKFLSAHEEMIPKAWPRYVWITDELPTTATNKILKRELVARGLDVAGGVMWKRDGTAYQLADTERRGPV